jgi:hypothetical protein
MRCRHGHHQRIAPYRLGTEAIADVIGAGKAHVVQVAMQPFDLLRQRHLEEALVGVSRA